MERVVAVARPGSRRLLTRPVAQLDSTRLCLLAGGSSRRRRRKRRWQRRKRRGGQGKRKVRGGDASRGIENSRVGR